LLKHQLCEEITFAENDESIYEGWIEGGIFTDDMTEIEDGKKLDIIVEVEIINNDDTAIKNMTYEIVIKGYKSFVLPT